MVLTLFLEAALMWFCKKFWNRLNRYGLNSRACGAWLICCHRDDLGPERKGEASWRQGGR